MELLQAVILAVIQGVTEWLPVSSSAHLALAQQLMGLQVPVSFDVMLHFGTLVSVAAYYREKVWGILAAVSRLDFKGEEGRLAVLILVAGVPTALIGFAGKAFFEGMFASPVLIGCALFLTGTVLFLTRYARDAGKPLSPASALVIGAAQGLAVAPGISRSGWTISAGMLLGVPKGKAADYAFLLSIPTVVAAAAVEGRNALFSDVSLSIVLAG